MNVASRIARWMTLWAAMTGFAAAQEPAPPAAAVTQSSHKSAQAEAGEPRADTTAQAEAGEPRADTSAAAPSPANARPAASAATGAGSKVPAAGSRTQRASAASAGGPQKSTAVDRIDLGVATVTGDREQPKVMYVVPWKKSDIGDLSGKPMNSLLDEALAPVDRDEFKREVMYYQAVQADASQNGASRLPAKSEK